MRSCNPIIAAMGLQNEVLQSHHRGDGVADLVRQPRRELTDRRHALGAHELRLRRLELLGRLLDLRDLVAQSLFLGQESLRHHL
jgi:hypothetical protein